MGKIIVFTGDDVNSARVKKAFEQRDIPFSEINVARYPSKLAAMTKAAFCESVPQVFFNTRHVGGVKETLTHLEQDWDNDKVYPSLRKKYEAQIGLTGDPTSLMAIRPTEGEKPEVPEPKVEERIEALPINLPDGTKTSVMDITTRLKNTLPKEDLSYKNIVYKSAFTGTSLLETIKVSLKLPDRNALHFAQQLMDDGIINHVGGGKDFTNDSTPFRMHCLSTPDVLNSYRKWTDDPAKDCIQISKDLDVMLTAIEIDSLDSEGLLDYSKIPLHPDFPKFEDAACELHTVQLKTLDDTAKLAFGINVYKIMLRYAFVKHGFPKNEADRLHMLLNIKFQVGSHLYSFREWVDGILRGNCKATYNSRVPFKASDERANFAAKKLDFRLHFALQSDPRFGSISATPFTSYSSKNLHEELNHTTRVFCNDEANFNISGVDEFQISRFFAWYRSDFGNDIMMFKILAGYLDFHKQALVQRKMKSIKSVKFIDIAWAKHASKYLTFKKKKLQGEVKGIAKLLHKFTAPKDHPDEAMRLATLHSLNILDSLPEERFDRITKMAKEDFDVPIVLVSLVDADRQWFKSKQWFCSVAPCEETGRDISFCGHAVLGGAEDVFVVENATEDERFMHNPLVTGDLNLRFYAGCPLSVSGTGNDAPMNVGTLCLIDQKPRKFSEEDCMKLRQYAYRIRRELRKSATDAMLASDPAAAAEAAVM